jgi:hypothetical protein
VNHGLLSPRDMGTHTPAHWPSRLLKPDCGHCVLDGELTCSLGAVPVPTTREEVVHACVFRANQPVPRDVLAYYFEMKVVQRGDRGDITIGFVPTHAKPGIQPGYTAALLLSNVTAGSSSLDLISVQLVVQALARQFWAERVRRASFQRHSSWRVIDTCFPTRRCLRSRDYRFEGLCLLHVCSSSTCCCTSCSMYAP